MENNNMIMETVNTAAKEVVKKADHTGAIFVGLGFIGGVAITAGAIHGAKRIKKVRKSAKEKNAINNVVATAEEK